MGFCHTKGAVRTFYADRMSELVDLETGEVATDCDRYIRDNALLWSERLDVEDPSRRALRDCRDDLAILVYVAFADGEFHPDEMDCAVLHVMESCDCQLDENHVRNAVASLHPTEETFTLALARVRKRERSTRPLLRSLRRIVDADGEVTVAETEAVERIEAALTRIA